MLEEIVEATAPKQRERCRLQHVQAHNEDEMEKGEDNCSRKESDEIDRGDKKYDK